MFMKYGGKDRGKWIYNEEIFLRDRISHFAIIVARALSWSLAVLLRPARVAFFEVCVCGGGGGW